MNPETIREEMAMAASTDPPTNPSPGALPPDDDCEEPTESLAEGARMASAPPPQSGGKPRIQRTLFANTASLRAWAHLDDFTDAYETLTRLGVPEAQRVTVAMDLWRSMADARCAVYDARVSETRQRLTHGAANAEAEAKLVQARAWAAFLRDDLPGVLDAVVPALANLLAKAAQSDPPRTQSTPTPTSTSTDAEARRQRVADTQARLAALKEKLTNANRGSGALANLLAELVPALRALGKNPENSEKASKKDTEVPESMRCDDPGCPVCRNTAAVGAERPAKDPEVEVCALGPILDAHGEFGMALGKARGLLSGFVIVGKTAADLPPRDPDTYRVLMVHENNPETAKLREALLKAKADGQDGDIQALVCLNDAVIADPAWPYPDAIRDILAHARGWWARRQTEWAKKRAQAQEDAKAQVQPEAADAMQPVAVDAAPDDAMQPMDVPVDDDVRDEGDAGVNAPLGDADKGDATETRTTGDGTE